MAQGSTSMAFAKTTENEALFRTSHGVTPSPWIMALPWVIRAPIIALYVDTLRPHDAFLTQLRKLVISVGFIISVAVMGTIAHYNLTIDNSTSAPAILVRFVLGPAFFVVFTGAYVAMRLTSLSMELITTVFIYSLWLLLTVFAISSPDFPSDDSLIVLAILAQLLRVPRLGLVLGLTAVSFVVAAVNQASYARGEPEYPLWALDGTVMRGAFSRLFQKGVSLFDYGLALAALQIQLLESDKLTEQAVASSAIALEVAERLGQYDTQGASEAIAEVAAEQVASPDLIAALTVLVDNLNKYRPHLPNWLLPRGSDDDNAMTRSRRQDDARTDRSLSSRRPRTRSAGGDSDAGGPRQDTDDTPKSVRSGGRDHTNTHSAREVAAEWFRNGASFTAEVTMAFLNFAAGPNVEISAVIAARRSVSSDSGLHLSKSQNSPADALSAFVDFVHRLANQYSAAVHSFVGDTVVLSWNAASRAVQSEAKAARMIARLRNRLASSSNGSSAMRVGGCVLSGSATIQLAGGARQQQAITISAPSWLSARQAAMTSIMSGAAHTGLVLLDAATKLASEFAVLTRPFAVATHRPHLDDVTGITRTAAYELLAECAEGGDDEWMYVLAKQQETSPAAAVTRDTVSRLFDLWQRGDDKALADELHRAIGSTSFPENNAMEWTMVQLNELGEALRHDSCAS